VAREAAKVAEATVEAKVAVARAVETAAAATEEATVVEVTVEAKVAEETVEARVVVATAAATATATVTAMAMAMAMAMATATATVAGVGSAAVATRVILAAANTTWRPARQAVVEVTKAEEVAGVRACPWLWAAPPAGSAAAVQRARPSSRPAVTPSCRQMTG
jgi:hypothetical protein